METFSWKAVEGHIKRHGGCINCAAEAADKDIQDYFQKKLEEIAEAVGAMAPPQEKKT